MNTWKIITFTFIFLIIILSAILFLPQSEEMDINGLKISKENFGVLNEANGYGTYNLCSFSQNKCVRMLKQKLP